MGVILLQQLFPYLFLATSIPPSFFVPGSLCPYNPPLHSLPPLLSFSFSISHTAASFSFLTTCLKLFASFFSFNIYIHSRSYPLLSTSLLVLSSTILPAPLNSIPTSLREGVWEKNSWVEKYETWILGSPLTVALHRISHLNTDKPHLKIKLAWISGSQSRLHRVE